MQHKKYYLGFSLFTGIGPVLFTKLFNQFGSAEAAWEGTEKKLQEILGPKRLEQFLDFRKKVDLDHEMDELVQKDIHIVTLEDKEYPVRLKEINTHPVIPDLIRDPENKILDSRFLGNDNKKDSSLQLTVNTAEAPKRTTTIPFLLYVKGDMSVLSFPKTIGIVGTRKITPYGKQVTDMLTADLVSQGFATVSGLALGVDAIVHISTIQNNGRTIAVLGSGVDICTPGSNQRIYDNILSSGGAVVSTFPPGIEPTVGSFPARNALIAGLSLGIVVTEGAADSGSLITANYAKKFGRPVFAVPGPITSSLSKGANSLLKDGAVAVTSARDILDTLGIIENLKGQKPSLKKKIGSTKEEQQILDILENGPLHFDEIVRRIGRDSKNVGSLLSLMELEGIIKSNGSMYSLNF